MASIPVGTASEKKVLVFGSQILDFSEESASELRSILLRKPHLSWTLDTIAELPTYWQSACKAIRNLGNIDGEKDLQELRDFIRTGSFSASIFPLRNILLTPLVVVSHLLQYDEFLEYVQEDSSNPEGLPHELKWNTETLGLCTGLLSATAVSFSTSRSQLARFGPIAIRLAMLIGAIVDSQDASSGSDGDSRCFSILWSSPETAAKVDTILKDFPTVMIKDNVPRKAH